MARETGLEPATSGVTGRRSNQLSYSPGRGSDRLAPGPSQAPETLCFEAHRSKTRCRQTPRAHLRLRHHVDRAGLEGFGHSHDDRVDAHALRVAGHHADEMGVRAAGLA